MLLGLKTAASKLKKKGGIPADCYEVEWLKVNGGAYIELDYFTGNRLRVQFKATYQTSSAEQDVICNQDNSTGRFVIGAASSKWFAYSRSSSKQDTNSWSDAITVGTTYEVVADYDSVENEKALSVDGVEFAKTSCTTIANTNKKVRLFRNTSGGYPFNGEVYYFKLDKDGSPWYDLVPVRREENGVSVGYLCDRLTGTLYGNVGTGSFVIGPDKYDAEVEWIESDGVGAYIDTGITIASDISFTTKFSKASSSTSAYILGALQGSQILLSCGIQFQIGGGRTASVSVDQSAHTVSGSYDGAMTIDGVSYPFTTQPSTTAISGRTMYVGCRNLRGVTDGFAAFKMYSLVINQADVLVRDFIPVRYRGVGYLYDRVSGRLFGNQGSGEFVIGADVRHAKDYVQNGLAYNFDAIENGNNPSGWVDLIGGRIMPHNAFSSFVNGALEINVTDWSTGQFAMYCNFDADLVAKFAEDVCDGWTAEFVYELVELDRNPSTAYAVGAAFGGGDSPQYLKRYGGGNFYWSAGYSSSFLHNIAPADETGVKRSFSTTGDIVNGRAVVFVDGAQKNQINSTVVRPTSAARYITVNGASYSGQRNCSFKHIRIYAMRFYNRVLTDAEILANYEIDKSRFGLVG